ncbi:MAG: hypothetical protein K0S88_5753 [Actinomycetia bacterium]|jgi:hypothetical protein|nr:hypothetical protein [Actinomycetes bacterium]
MRPGLSQVAGNRQGRSNAFSAISTQAVPASHVDSGDLSMTGSPILAVRARWNTLIGGSSQARTAAGVSAQRQEVEGLDYWSGMRRVKNSTSSDAAGGSRLLRLTTT